jgi:hypothetical protein
VKTTIHTPAGRIVLEQSATRASVQVAFFPADGAPVGFLIPNASAGVFTQAVEAVATLNEESNEPELDDLDSEWLDSGTEEIGGDVQTCMPLENPAALDAARRFAEGFPSAQEFPG